MKELLEKMNKALEVLNNTRINDFGKFHEKIEELISDLLPTGFNYLSWSINYKEIGQYRSLEIFKLNFDFIDDKRVKITDRRGKLIGCKFIQVIEGETIDELKESSRKKEVKESIVLRNERIVELKKELNEEYIELEKLIKEKQSWEK